MRPHSQYSTSDYFGGTGIPNWLEDETLYSLISRFHHLSGNPSAHITSTQLFGGSKVGYQHDLPCGLEEFSRITGGSHGSAHSIIREHTILPYYLPFRTEHDAEDAYSTMASSSLGSLKYRLGILTSRFRAHHPLKACASCMAQDRDNNSVAYWHLTHQYPGVWVCLKHKEPLLTSIVKSTGTKRFQWVLPDEDILNIVLKDNSFVAGKYFLQLQRLSESAISLAQLPNGFHFDMQKLLRVYQNELFKQGFVSNGGSFRLNDIAESFLDTVKLPPSITELAALPSSIPEAKHSIGRLLRTPRSGTHPLRHLAIFLWLFQGWNSFFKNYQRFEPVEHSTKQLPKMEADKNQEINKLKDNLVKLILDGNFTVTGAARNIGIDPNTAIAWASERGISTPRRPKTLKAPLRENLIADIKKGFDKLVLSHKYHVSTPTITRLIRSELGLQQEWLDAQFNKKLRRERNKWAKLIKTHGKSGIKALRMILPATYMWLYRNDRKWFENKNCGLPKMGAGNYSNVNWDSRDIKLSEDIEKIILELTISDIKPKITLGGICQLLPDLKAKLDRLDKLPLTHRILQRMLGKKFHRNIEKQL